MTGLFRLTITYAAALAVGLLIYIALIRSPLLGGMSILFYRGVLLAGIAATLMLGGGAFAMRRANIDPPTIVGGVALSLAFNICFLITFPVTFDRSITMFLLARIERQDGQLTTPMLEDVFAREYLRDMRQIDRRVEEQALSGNIRVDHGRIRITPQGARLLAGGRIVSGWFGADPRFVSPPPVEQTH